MARVLLTMPPMSGASHGRRLSAEFLGTFALVFIGAGSVVVEAHTGMSHQGLADGKVRLLGIALAHGLTLSAMICAFGSISGGHFNPAVSLAVFARGALRPDRFLGYVLAQFSGATVAGLILAGLFPDEIALAGLGTPALAAKITILKGTAIEAIITFFLVTTILFVTRDDNEDKRFAGVAIGFTLTAVILFAGPLTGGAANPARFAGPALASAKLSEFIVYLAGPMLGAIAAAFAHWVIEDTRRVPDPVRFADLAQSQAPAGATDSKPAHSNIEPIIERLTRSIEADPPAESGD